MEDGRGLASIFKLPLSKWRILVGFSRDSMLNAMGLYCDLRKDILPFSFCCCGWLGLNAHCVLPEALGEMGVSYWWRQSILLGEVSMFRSRYCQGEVKFYRVPKHDVSCLPPGIKPFWEVRETQKHLFCFGVAPGSNKGKINLHGPLRLPARLRTMLPFSEFHCPIP